ncbi:AAA family ATPase [Candidatus Woesearchaeota archaeon]|nr:AAA family ATPase [Candidatus Woesearchaeota archaeon]
MAETQPPQPPQPPQQPPFLKLKVMEAVQDDVNRGIVKIDSTFLKQIGVNPGDFVEIKGERATAAMVDRAYPGDLGLNLIRMDGNTRRNTRTSIGELVTVKKADIKSAKKVTLAPATKGIMIKASPELFKQGLFGKALVKGDLVSLGRTRRKTHQREFEDIFSVMQTQLAAFPAFGFGDIKFMVIDTLPKKEILVVTEETEVEFNPQAVEFKEEEGASLGINYEDIGGLGDEIKKVREMIELPLKHPELFERLGIEPPKGVLLHGPPGTGKTLLAKAVASETNSHFILINGPEIISKFYGESEQNLRKKFEEAEKNAPSIIFFDEIDAIAAKREEVRGEVEKRVVAQLLSLMDGLIDREIEIGVPDKNGRLDILKIHSRNMPLAKNVDLKEIAKVTHGFVGADVSSLTKEAAMIVLRRIFPDLKAKGFEDEERIPEEILAKIEVTQKDFQEALKIVRPSAMREVLVETPDVNWNDIGGLEEIKSQLKEAVEWPLKKPEVFERMGIRPPRGILLYGPPGTGKTLLAKAVAKESEANFILINGPSLLSKWVGESEKGLRDIFRKARQTAPTIIFFDEIDALFPRRYSGSDGSKVKEGMVNQLLAEMDGLEGLQDVVVIGATNRPDLIDPALLRPGRFDRIILAPVQDEEGRKRILEIYLKKMPIASDVLAEELAKLTQGYVGADIEGLCREAAMVALRENDKAKEVKKAHFKKALEQTHPSVDKETEDSYKKIQEYFSSARARQLKEAKKREERERERNSYVG